MADGVETLLRSISSHAWWTRDAEWNRSWFTGFFTPLVSAGFPLPPLFAYDLRSAAERGDRRRGVAAGRRKHPASWDAFMAWAHALGIGNLSNAQSLRTDRRTEAMQRVAQLISASLIDQVDISGLRGRGGVLDPKRLLDLEGKRISGSGNSDGALQKMWSHVEGVVASGRFYDLVSIAEGLPFQGRKDDDLDTFVPRLLELGSSKTDWMEPSIRGTNPRADNSRMMLTPTGEFAKRDLGGIPSELGRLAPTELVMLREAGAKPRGGKLRSRSVAFRTLFLYRATQGHLLQRYSQSVKPDEMEPIVHVQIDLLDTPEAHRLSDPPHPPIISWYRAVAVELVHTLARLSKSFRWAMTFRLHCSDGVGARQAVFTSSAIAELGASRQRALEVLVAGLPEAFASRRGVRRDAPDTDESDPSEVDLWARIVLGERHRDGGATSIGQPPRAAYERGVRVERIRNGDYGFAASQGCSETHQLHIDLNRRGTSPSSAANEIVSVLLDESEEESHA